MTKKHPSPATRNGFGILNASGDLWTSNLFDTEAAARKYLEDFWRGNKGAPDLATYRFVPAQQTTVVRVPETAAA